ncbi:MAG: RES family NAD+ phosphorylase [Gemmatimonadetes bacterium]|nr:RES family NAD+ phosphorylase [Gemmatimonadota bacterium]
MAKGRDSQVAGGTILAPAAVYAAENRALAVLETLVHTNPRRIPPDLVLLTISIPDDVPQTTWSVDDLPPGWRELGADPARDRGTQWLTARTGALLWTPSAILPAEFNAILNPAHPDHARARIAERESFAFDPRLLALRAPPR